ncbi:hypothetical protein [Azospirillum thermophilum]|uniref:Lipoprotein n=1 Tax=Azospirillum thermophilum TaxID=2202148 RepID=A0A2S2CZG3_9PROT|nr:hypothetical protein [Azospirillum thermophilum]AWK89892.1 hypothetical protein DEW08_28140 [Azospirillum thermophilum]
MRASPTRSLILLCIAGAALAGCGAGRVIARDPTPAYSPAEASYAASGRDLRVTVQGDPFGGDRQRLTAAVVQALQGTIMGVATNFTATPGPTARRDYGVAVVFNPTTPVLGSEICGGVPVPTAPPSPGAPMRVEAAFCRGGALTSSFGTLEGATGPDDPDFRGFIASLGRSLFPPARVESCGGVPDC